MKMIQRLFEGYLFFEVTCLGASDHLAFPPLAPLAINQSAEAKNGTHTHQMHQSCCSLQRLCNNLSCHGIAFFFQFSSGIDWEEVSGTAKLEYYVEFTTSCQQYKCCETVLPRIPSAQNIKWIPIDQWAIFIHTERYQEG